MKKMIIISCMFCLCITGCTSNNMQEEQQKVYNGFKESLMNNGELISTEIPFDYNIEIEEQEGLYIYEVTIKKPLVVMTSIKALLLNPEDLTTDYVSSTKGIFDELSYHMVPNQENVEDGYVTEIVLTGVSNEPDFRLYTMIVFKDRNQLTQSELYFSFNIVDGKNVKETTNEKQ